MIIKKIKKVGALSKNYFKVLSNSVDELIFIATSIGIKNWGDALNLTLVKEISGKTPVIAYDPLNLFKSHIKNRPIYSVIGSVLENRTLNHNLNIWGTGCISR